MAVSFNGRMSVALSVESATEKGQEIMSVFIMPSISFMFKAGNCRKVRSNELLDDLRAVILAIYPFRAVFSILQSVPISPSVL